MTQAPTPGPLTSESVKLLVKGDLVGAGELIGILKGVADGWGCATIIAPNGAEFSRILHKGFTFIGRPDADGWMPWSGGENPVPGQRVQWRTRNETDRVMSVLSNNLDWTHECRRGFDPIIAFRLAPTAPVEASGSEQLWSVGSWLSAALDDPKVCDAMKSDIRDWFDNGGHLRPQPSGETRAAVARIIADHVAGGFDAALQDKQEWKDRSGLGYDCEPSDVNGPFKDDYLDAADAILALLSARPLALGGQQGEFNVEEYVADYEFRADGEGGCYTPTENERALLIDAIHGALSELSLSTTPARAEAQDEGAAGELKPCPFCGGEAEIIHLDDGDNAGGSCVCCTKCQASGNVEFGRKENFVDNWNRRAHPSPTPAADADRVRIAVEALEYYAGPHAMPNDGPWGASSDDYGRRASEAIAALKLGRGK